MCVGNAVLHCGQTESCFGFFASCARRLPVRALLCLRFGTAIFAHLQPTLGKSQILNDAAGCVNQPNGNPIGTGKPRFHLPEPPAIAEGIARMAPMRHQKSEIGTIEMPTNPVAAS